MDHLTTIRSIIYLTVVVYSALAYDEYSSSCMRPGRTSKAWPEPPCDFKNQAWCTAPGSAYPWHAVRRFVHENQGLMRRMYGDMRQISVLRAEYESNDVLYHGDGADFQLIRDGVTKRYRPVTERSTPTSTVSNNNNNNRARSTTSTTTTSTSTTTSRTTSTVSTPTSTISTTTKKHPSTTTTTTLSPTSSVTDSSVTTEIATDDTTLTSTTSGSTLDTTLALEEREKEIAEVVEALEESTEDDQQFGETEDQLAAESELEYEESEEIAEEEEPEKEQPQILRRGVNACPVKEEVVAPFWANNTRGEILALLNLYPFEQYVHWEKCTDEHQQMFCRDGCRCEQQYRLHRLLAYDPRNECRGIFSDWFKFPSCCVCKCYDIPPEFRLTSRSPRRGNTKPNNNIKKVHIKSKAVRLEEDDDSIPINGLETRDDGGEMRADLQAVVHHADKPHRPGRGYFETATIGPVDAATPHFYYQPPAGILQLSRRPRNV